MCSNAKIVHLECAPREYPDQTAHSRSLFRIFTRRILNSQGCKLFRHADNQYSDQTVRMRRLVCIFFVGRACQKVRFLSLRLIIIILLLLLLSLGAVVVVAVVHVVIVFIIIIIIIIEQTGLNFKFIETISLKANDLHKFVHF